MTSLARQSRDKGKDREILAVPLVKLDPAAKPA